MTDTKQITPPVKLSIIIVSFNTRDVTDDCLRSIYAAEWRDPFEVIVVDNNSHDGSCEMIREKYPRVKLIANPDNRLFSKANNQGAAIAQGKYLLLLNSDTLVDGDNLQRMTEWFDTLPDDVICIGPKVLNRDGSLQSCGMMQWGKRMHHYVSLYNLDKILPMRLLSPIWDRRPDVSRRTGWVVGCCMMIPRDKYLKVGGLNEKLVFYGEEPEFGYRTDRLGYKTMYYAGASIIHLGGVSTDKKEYSFERDIRQYNSLVQLTIGNRGAMRTTRRTITSLRVKLLFYSNKDFIRERIAHEKRVWAYFRDKDREERRHKSSRS